MAVAAPVRTNWHPDKKHSDVERWVCIYPAYINSKKTRQEGRRLPREECVENPSYAEIRDVLAHANLHVGVENKLYSRERSKESQFRGRIRVQMRNDNGTPCNSELASREAIMRYITSKIPQLKTRQGKGSDSYSQQQSGGQVQYSSGGGGGGGSSGGVAGGGGGGGGGVGGGKKGKGKRR